MIRVCFFQDTRGLLRKLEVKGHEPVKIGELALACASVSCLVRSFVRLCQVWGLGLHVRAPKKGEFFFSLESLPDSTQELYAGAVALLKQTFLDLVEEGTQVLELKTVFVE